MSRPNAARVICAGSGPPRTPVWRASIAASWTSVRSKSKMSKFSSALLQVPAQHHLGRCLGVGGRDLVDDRVRQGAAVGAVPVEGDAADRRPRLGQDPVLGVDRQELGLPKVGVHLDLVHSRHHRRGRQQR
jgi:hypothetical protein